MKQILFLFVAVAFCCGLSSQAILGEICVTTTDCINAPGETDLIECNEELVCACTDNAKPDGASLYCIAKVLGDACTVRTDCDKIPGDAALIDCIADKCSCTADAKPEESTCIAKGLGDACTAPTDCDKIPGDITLSDCIADICSCTADAKPEESTCIARGLGDACTAPTDCDKIPGDITLSDCIADICSCTADAKPDGATCTAKVLGDDCPCNHIAEFECNSDSKCGCKTEFVVSEDFKQCLAVTTEWGGPCTENKQCSTFQGEVECKEATCQCKAGNHYVEDGMKCWADKDLGEECTDTKECVVTQNQDKVECKEAKCACKSGYKPDDTNAFCKSAGDKAALTMFALLPVLLLSIRKSL